MCKIAIVTGVVDDNRDLVLRFVKEMSKEMSFNDRDGFGYSAVDKNGNMFSERWLSNAESFNIRESTTQLEETIEDYYQGFLIGKGKKYDSYGTVNLNELTSITLHARMATSGVEFENTHPFIVDDTSLIHNGVISNQHNLVNKISSCDSECILNEYIKSKVAEHPKNIQKVANKLQGYYACAVITNTKEHGKVIDIFKCHTAQLTGNYVSNIGVVISTSAEHVESAARLVGQTVEVKYKVKSGCMIRLDAITGEVIMKVNFKPKEYERVFSNNSDYTTKDNWSKSSVQEALRKTNEVKRISENKFSNWEKTEDGSWIKRG